jgi:replicative DNA helicase
LSAGDLIILAARPSMGKTALAMNIAENVAVHQKKTVLVFSLEMTAEQLMDRMAASIGDIPYELIRSGKVFEHPDHSFKASPAISLLKDAPLFIDDRPALSIPQVRASARRIHKQSPLSLIVVDYLQLMRAKAESRVMEVTQISQGLKALAKELGVPVLALSQLSRAVETRAEKRPVNSDLRDSGAIEQDADVIMFIYRDEVYNEQSKYAGIAEIRCTKQRNGPIGDDYLRAQLDRCRFTNLAAGWTKPEEEKEQPKFKRGFDYQ